MIKNLMHRRGEKTPVTFEQLTRWRVSTFWVMLIGYIGYYLVRGNLSVAMPLLAQEFGYTNTQLGVMITFSELAYALGKFTTGPLADQIGGKKVFMTGLIGGIVFNFIFPLFPNLVFFTVIWCLVRYFLSMGWGGIIKTIGEWYEPERNGTIMGLISINFQFGSVIAALFCSLLIYLGANWSGLFYWPALTVTAVAVWSYFASKESPQVLLPGVRFGKNAGSKKSVVDLSHKDGKALGVFLIMQKLLQVRLFRQLLVFSFFIHILRSFFMFWIPKFMVDIGMKNLNAALSSAVFPLVGCLGTIALGWYTDRYAKNGDRTRAMWKMLFGLVLTLLAIAVLVPYKLEYQVSIVVLIGFAGLFLYGPYSMGAGCMSLDIAGAEGAGTCTGLLDGVGYIGGAFAAWGAGVIADKFGWQDVFYSLAGFALFTVVWTYAALGDRHLFPPTVRQK